MSTAQLGGTTLDVTDQINEILNRRPAVGLAVCVVRDGSVEFHGHGYADVAAGTRVTEDTVFRIGSITKTFTAIAVTQLWQRGLLDPDAPAENYLRSYRLVPASPGYRLATVRDLLTHTAGLPQVLHPSRVFAPAFGDFFPPHRPPPSLARYYRGALRQVAEPGTRFTYGNHGFATLGQIVEDVTGTPLHRYFREHIFTPLGMDDTDLLRSGRIRSRLATGYRVGSRGVVPAPDGELVTAAAGAVYSTPRDMARYVAALLGGGSNAHGSVLTPAALATMFEPHYRTDPRVPGMGLAFFRHQIGGRPAIEHQGIIPAGFNSELWLAPDHGTGVVAFTNGSPQAMMWLPVEFGALLGRLIGAPEDQIRTDVPHRPDTWRDLIGWYTVSAQLTDTQARSFAGLGAEVFVRRGRLMIRALSPLPAAYRGFALHPDDPADPYAYRIDLSEFGLGTAKIVFSRDAGRTATGISRGAGGTATGVHLDILPLSLHRRPASRNPRRWTAGALGALGTGVAAATLWRGVRAAHPAGRR